MAVSEAASPAENGPEPAPSILEKPYASEQPDLRLKIGPIRIDPHAAIYATIMVMTSFALVDEGPESLSDGPWLTLLGATIAPLFALASAHAFSDALDMQIREGHRLTMSERRHIAAKNLQFMYVAIPPIALLLFFVLIDMDASDAVGFILLFGIASLFYWGVFAGKKAGLGPWRRVSFGIGYGVMGVIVLLVELVLTH